MESRNSYALDAMITFMDEEQNVIMVEYYTECPNVTVDPFTLMLKNVSTDGSRSTIYYYKEVWVWDEETKTYQLMHEEMEVLTNTESYALKKESMLEDFCNSDVKIIDGDGNFTLRKVVKVPKRDKKWIVPRGQQRDHIDLGDGNTQVLPSKIQWDIDYEQGDD